MRVYYPEQADEICEAVGSGILLIGAPWSVNVRFLDVLESLQYTGNVFSETIPCYPETMRHSWLHGVRPRARTRAYWVCREDVNTAFDFGTYVSSNADSVVVGGSGALSSQEIKNIAHVDLVVHHSVEEFAKAAVETHRRSHGRS